MTQGQLRNQRAPTARVKLEPKGNLRSQAFLEDQLLLKAVGGRQFHLRDVLGSECHQAVQSEVVDVLNQDQF
ncbi:hypothetical protein D9M72_601980 [compost metagenome]